MAKLTSKSIKCSKLKVKDGQFYYTNDLNLGSRAYLHCNQGFVISSENQSSDCLSNGLWSHFENYNLSCHQIECPNVSVKQISNAKIYFKFNESKPIYSPEMKIDCNNNKTKVLVYGQNSNLVQLNDIENSKSIIDLFNLCKSNPKPNTTLSNYNSIELTDINSSVIASVMTAITTTLIVLILFSVIMFLKRKFLASHSIRDHKNKTMSSEEQF